MSRSPSDDAASRLGQITDDSTPRQECLDWLVNEMWQGRDPDALLAELVSNGWGADDVQPLIDEARKQTRGSRSVLGSRDRAAQKTGPLAGEIINRGIVKAVLGAVNDKLGAETAEIRYRIKHGRCHQCGQDLSTAIDRCPTCGSAVVRQTT